MSYASEVKKELTGITVHEKNARAELMALIRMNGSIGLANHAMILNVQTESPAIARRIYSLIKQLYKVESDILVRKKMKLKKNNTYVVRLRHQSPQPSGDDASKRLLLSVSWPCPRHGDGRELGIGYSSGQRPAG